jgi:predicted RNase H-like HicB family nuclease
LPGCVGAAESVEELKELMREAIQFHIEGLREEGETIPTPSTRAADVSVTI